MLVTMIVVLSLLTGGAIVLSTQLSSTRATDLSKTGRTALYCAESGLAAGRTIVTDHYVDWGKVLDPSTVATQSAWYPITRDLDNNGSVDVEITLRDNDDEQNPTVNDLTKDSDLRVFIVATCKQFAETPRQLVELVEYTGGGANYRSQAGQGAGNTGNNN